MKYIDVFITKRKRSHHLLRLKFLKQNKFLVDGYILAAFFEKPRRAAANYVKLNYPGANLVQEWANFLPVSQTICLRS